jgi:hypothetical protein
MRIATWWVSMAIVVVLAVWAPSASAAVRSVAIDDGVDYVDGRAEIVSVGVDYDDSGTVAVRITYNVAPPGSFTANVTLAGAKTCSGGNWSDDPVRPVTIHVHRAPDATLSASATYPPYERVPLNVSGLAFAGVTLTATLSGTPLTGQDYRCVRGSDGSPFQANFAGFEAQYMVPDDASRVMDGELARRYGDSWTSGPGRWLSCPASEFKDTQRTGADAFGRCGFRLREGARWRQGSAEVRRVDGYLVVSKVQTRTFVKAVKRCRIRSRLRVGARQILDRELMAGGWVSCEDERGSMIRDLHRLAPGVREVHLHGASRAGFAEADNFRCRISERGRRRTASCLNHLGDRVVYRYTLA